MDSNPQPSANGPPPKPWERAGSSSGPAPFKPPSAGSTSDVVEASGTAKPGEIVPSSDRNTAANRNALARPVPSRPWEQNYGSSTNYGGYGSTMNYNSGYGSGISGTSGMYGSYGGSGGLYGGGMYGNNSMYRGGYGGGGLYGSSGMYGGGMYNSSLGAPVGGYGMGMGGNGMGMGGPYGGQDPNDPYGPPPSHPGFWISVLRVTQGVVNFFGRIAILIDQNTQAFHLFMSALLQLFDRSGLLYGELARFVFRILGVKTKSKVHPPGPNGFNGPHGPNGPNGPHGPYGGNQNFIEGPRPAPSGGWDNVWENDAGK